MWLITFSLHIHEKDEFESRPKGLICLCAEAPIPTPSLNCGFSTHNFEQIYGHLIISSISLLLRASCSGIQLQTVVEISPEGKQEQLKSCE